MIRTELIHSQCTILVSSYPLQILNGLNQHLVLVLEVIHIGLQEIHFLLQEKQQSRIKKWFVYFEAGNIVAVHNNLGIRI